MQTFLPLQSFNDSLTILDNKRLGKQRVEALQILNALAGLSKGWVNHPATRMWKGYEDALKLYYNTAIAIWIARGFKNTMVAYSIPTEITLPPWFGNYDFHRSHQSNLVRKDPVYYKQFFPDVPDNLHYVWPA